MKSFFYTLVSGVFWIGTACGNGATLTSIPVGSMIHANIGYFAAEKRLGAHVDSIIPALVPLDVSHPADNFDPAKAWFPYLDPSEQGMAYSRQYGLVMDDTSDPIPIGMSIWFRLISHSPGLGLYSYKESGKWDPILGTEGSTNLLIWSLMMVHPGIAAPPATGAHSAVLEAFAVDLATGTQRSDIAPAQFTLEWTNTPSVRMLRIMPDKTLCWSAAATNFVLETAPQVASASWSVVTNNPSITDGEFRLPIDSESGSRFFRLRRVP